jgi:hypothetical protein
MCLHPTNILSESDAYFPLGFGHLHYPFKILEKALYPGGYNVPLSPPEKLESSSQTQQQ